MKSITRNVIIDLIPVYLSGEASDDTRKLVEKFAESDTEIAKMLAEEISIDSIKTTASPEESLELKTFRNLRTGIRRQMVLVAMGTIALLMIPWIAMQFTAEVQWDGMDFIVMGSMLLTAGLSYIFISRISGHSSYKAAVGLAVLSGFLLLWINVAVGIIGSENHPANLLYLGVLLIGVLGAFLVRFRPSGMTRVLFMTASLQFLIPFVALLIWHPVQSDFNGFMGILIFNTIFALLFATSGILFRKAI